ncbi:hypothetical protein LIER_36103 [Lithospermum erythrorhizon]|uniref:Uncharacterized protein n=1 Tax=Lithospermum erythrorhizon TaxID=34254 RepID=A0AAV3P0V0_LITER
MSIISCGNGGDDDIHRVDSFEEAGIENPGSQKVLEKASFKKSVLRKCCLLKGNPRDMGMFSLITSDQ